MALLSLLEMGVTLVMEIVTAFALGIVVANLITMQKRHTESCCVEKKCTLEKDRDFKDTPKKCRPFVKCDQ